MRIEALVIPFTVIIAATSAVAADPVLGQEPRLPQFVSPAARADVVQLARASDAAEETRQAAKILSGKFSEGMPPAKVAVSADEAGTAETAGPDDREYSKMQGRVAVLVAESPPKSTRAKKAKIGRAKPAAAAKNHASRRMRTANSGKPKGMEGPQNLGAHLDGPPRNASTLASSEVPGAKTGWQTGIIGFLTNPTFWH
jgi:hypothetical protein